MRNKKKVIICALGDYYWANYAEKMSIALIDNGYQPVIVSESRLGEYQNGFSRAEYKNCQVYYLSDFSEQYTSYGNVSFDKKVVFSDFIRLRTLGGAKLVGAKRWDEIGELVTAFVDFVFDEEQEIYAVLHEAVSTSLSYAFYSKCTKQNVPYMGFLTSKFPDRFEHDLPFDTGAELIRKEYNRLLSDPLSVDKSEYQWADEYINNIVNFIPDYMKKNVLNSSSFLSVLNIKNLKAFIGSLLYSIVERSDKSHQILREGAVLAKFRSFSRNLLRRLRMKSALYNFDSIDNDWMGRSIFYVFPIHYQPEGSTSVGSPFFEDQLMLIRNIAFSLDKDEYLVVKEHVSNYGYFAATIYEEIKSLPGVKLIGPEHNIKNIVMKSKGVITLTSTVGFEAVLLEKPVIVFGDVFYNKHPLCRKINSVFEIGDAFSEIEKVIRSGEVDNRLYLLAYKSFTSSGRVIYGADCLNMSASTLNYLKDLPCDT